MVEVFNLLLTHLYCKISYKTLRDEHGRVGFMLVFIMKQL